MSNLFLKIKNKIKNWRQGEYISCKNTPNTIVLAGYYKRTTSAKCLNYIFKFLSNNYKWVLPLIVTIGILIFNILNYFKK